MKTLVACLFLLAATTALADIEGAPFIPEIDARFNAIEQGNHFLTNKFPSGAADGHYVMQEVKATYDFSKQTGATNTYDLGVSIPANAIIQRSFLYSLIQPTTSASGTLAFYCQNAADILTTTAAASYASAGASIDGSSTGSASTFKYTTAKCDIHAVIATGALTAGKVTAVVRYTVHQ